MTGKTTPLPSPQRGVAPSTVIPAGRLKTWTRVVLLKLALTAAGLRAWLSPWLAPGNRSLGPLYSKGSRASPGPWAR